jgi:hypothetical protein
LGAAPEFAEASRPMHADFEQARQSARDGRGFGPSGEPMNRAGANGESSGRDPMPRDSMPRDPMPRDSVSRSEPARPPFGSGRRHAESDRGGALDGPEEFGAEATYRMTAADRDRARASRVDDALGGESTYRLQAGRGSIDSGRGADQVDPGRGRAAAPAEATYRMAAAEPGAAVDATYRMAPSRRPSSDTGPGGDLASAEATYRLTSVGERGSDRVARERDTPEWAESDRPEEGRRRSTGSRHADERTTGFRTVAELISATGGERVVSRRAQSRADRAEEPERAVELPRAERRLESPSQRALRVVPSDPIESDSSRGPLGPAEGGRGTGFGAYGEAPRESEAHRDEPKSARSQMFRNRAIESSLPNAAVVSQQFGAESGPRRADAPPALRAVSGDAPTRGDFSMPDDAPVRGSGSMRAVTSTSGGFAAGGAPAADIGSGPRASYDSRNSMDRSRDESVAEPRRPRHDAIEAAEPSRRSDRAWNGGHDSGERDGRAGHEERAGVEDSSALGSLDSSALFGTLSGMRAVPERAPR